MIMMNSQAQPSWEVTPDPESYPQNIVIYATVPTMDSFAMLEEGDILGAFYTTDRYTDSQCAGKITWGTDNVMKIYNDSLIKNETSVFLYFKLWKKSEDCILDSVKGIFRSPDDTWETEMLTSDTLYLERLSAKPFRAGYSLAEYCDNEIIIPIPAPDEYNITYACDQFTMNTVTGEINLNGSFSGDANVRFSSDYCLATYSQSLTVFPSPAKILPAEMNICEGDPVRSLFNQFVDESVWISETMEISPSIHQVVLDNGKCQTIQEVKVNELPKPLIQTKVDDLCDSVRISLLNDGGTMQWSTGSLQNQVLLSSDNRIWVHYTDNNGCTNSDTLNVKIKKIAITELETEEIDAGCYTSGKVNVRKINVENDSGFYDTLLKNLITGEEVPVYGLLKEGRYRLSVRDVRGCTANWNKELVILKDCLTDNPVFSPNNDGRDDDFFISYEGMIYIYDKNGRLLHKFQGPSYWDGTDDRGSRLPLGIYLMVTGSEAKTITILR